MGPANMRSAPATGPRAAALEIAEFVGRKAMQISVTLVTRSI
jgi:hypothetical protein